MSDEMKRNEIQYQVAMSLARKMLADGTLTRKIYCEYETKMKEKYKPGFGDLFSDISLKTLDNTGV